jgi:hypothetical protein
MSIDIEIWKDSDDAFWIFENDIWYFWDENEWQWLAPSATPSFARRKDWHQVSPLSFLVLTGKAFHICYERGERIEEEMWLDEHDYSPQYEDE